PSTSYDDVWRTDLSRFCTLEMNQWEQIVRNRQILRRIPDHQGNPMYTEERLFTYLQQFERDFAGTRTRIIDASEGGAGKRGATSMKLTDAIEQFCRQPVPQAPADLETLSNRLSDCLFSIEARRADANQIE